MNERMKQFYMNIAQECANMSRAIRLQVGSVIVKDNNIISFSWNGTPAGWDNDCEDKIYPSNYMGDFEQHYDEFDAMFPFVDEVGKRYKLKTKPEVLHAESNAIAKLARSNDSGDSAAIFITHAPCMECAKLIYQSGIKQVYFKNYYRDESGINFLNKCHIEIEKLDV